MAEEKKVNVEIEMLDAGRNLYLHQQSMTAHGDGLHFELKQIIPTGRPLLRICRSLESGEPSVYVTITPTALISAMHDAAEKMGLIKQLDEKAKG